MRKFFKSDTIWKTIKSTNMRIGKIANSAKISDKQTIPRFNNFWNQILIFQI